MIAPNEPAADGGPAAILVVTPSYQQGTFLGETIESVVSQMDDHTCYVVADGGSTDNSGEVLRHYQPQISDVLLGPDDGQSDAIVKSARRGVELFGWADRAVWFNWINSDDRLGPGCLDELRGLIAANPSVDAIAMNVQTFGDESYRMPNQRLTARAMLRDERYRFAQPGLWLRWDRLAEIGGIDTTLQYGFDWDLWVRYLASFPNVVYSQQVGAEFRLHPASKTSIETALSDDLNQFEVEHRRIRHKLSEQLRPDLAKLAIPGGERRHWHQQLSNMLDCRQQSTGTTLRQIAKAVWQNPHAVASTQTAAATLRLLSRYVRPKKSYFSTTTEKQVA